MTTETNGIAGTIRSWLRGASGAAAPQRQDSHEEWFAAVSNAHRNMKRREIDTTIVDAATSKRFMDRVIAQWQVLGETDPYWSNDAQDQFRADNLTKDGIARFYEEGAGVLPMIEAFESRAGVDIQNGVCMELGCGVGKHTHALARRFARVVGIDISGPGLAVCAGQMARFGVGNFTPLRLTSPEDLSTCGPIDLFLSLSVLQHNPPPIQKRLIEVALDALAPGGFALFQTPDYVDASYRFSAETFLAAEEAMLDLHCLPKADVLQTLERNGMRLLDFAPDAAIGDFGSYTYFARKGGA